MCPGAKICTCAVPKFSPELVLDLIVAGIKDYYARPFWQQAKGVCFSFEHPELL